MAKLHWTPWMALSELAQEAEQFALEAERSPEAGYAWQPVADVLETAEDFRITLELPGVARQDVHLEARGRELVVTGVRRFTKAPGGVYQALERSHGPFARRFVLPKGVSRGEIAAVMKDGLLVVVVPKIRPERLRRRIPIS